MKILCSLLLLMCGAFPVSTYAQHTTKNYYDGTKQPYSVQHWNKKNTCAYFVYYHPNGMISGEGHELWDRYRRNRLPDSTFTAYDTSGKMVQTMRITSDSGIAIMYHKDGSIASKIWFDERFFYEDVYFDNGNVLSRYECTLPDSLNFFTSYHNPSAIERKYSDVMRIPEPLLPMHYGIPATGGFLVYSYPESIFPHHFSVCNSFQYFPDGELMRTVQTAPDKLPVMKEYNEDGSPYNGPLRSYKADGTLVKYTDGYR